LQACKSRAARAGTGGGAVVETGTKEFAGQLHHEQPLIHCSGTAVIILYGFLSNLDELFKRIDADSCSGAHAYSFGDGGSLSSRRFYSQSHAAEALLEVYLQTKASDLLIMLSELQVALSMFIFCISSIAACNIANGICKLHWDFCLLVCNMHSIEATASDLNHSQHCGVTN